MSLNWRLSRRDAHQSRLEGLDGRGHNGSCWQLVPNLNSSREETVVKGIDTPSWNTELTTVSSRILGVWSQIQWCRYCDQSVDYSVHHHSSGLIFMYFQLLHHKSWTSFAARRTSRLTVWPAPVIHHRSCCTSLNCFNLVNVVSSMWSPDSWSILLLKLRTYKGSVCRCLNFQRTALCALFS